MRRSYGVSFFWVWFAFKKSDTTRMKNILCIDVIAIERNVGLK
jgi:hypothetical protein